MQEQEENGYKHYFDIKYTLLGKTYEEKSQTIKHSLEKIRSLLTTVRNSGKKMMIEVSYKDEEW